jgi:hypothetical protein
MSRLILYTRRPGCWNLLPRFYTPTFLIHFILFPILKYVRFQAVWWLMPSVRHRERYVIPEFIKHALNHSPSHSKRACASSKMRFIGNDNSGNLLQDYKSSRLAWVRYNFISFDLIWCLEFFKTYWQDNILLRIIKKPPRANCTDSATFYYVLLLLLLLLLLFITWFLQHSLNCRLGYY